LRNLFAFENTVMFPRAEMQVRGSAQRHMQVMIP